MRATEFITEAKIGELNIGSANIIVDDHALEQAVNRNVLPSDVDKVLKKFAKIENEIKKINDGQQFWVYDSALEVGLGFRKLSGVFRLILKTVVGSKPYDGQNPVISIPDNQPSLEEEIGQSPWRWTGNKVFRKLDSTERNL